MTNCCVDQFANIGKCCSSGADITLCYQTIGDKSKPCLLLLSEMGMSGIALWHDSFIKELASSNAYYIVMFDYRDCGKSTHLNRKFDTYNNSIISSRGNSSNLSQDNKLCKVEGNTLTQNNAQRRVVKSNKEMRNSDNTEKINCSSYKESNEEKCDDNDFDEENDIINELFESAENNKLPNVTNKHVRTKMSSSESKTSKCVTEINTSRSSSPSTLSIYVQLLRAFHTPGKYLVQCPYTLSDMAHDAWELLLAHLSVKEVHLVGFSFGGMVAQMMAIQHPSKVKSLTLLATHTSNLNKTQWPSYMEILRYVRLLPSELSPIFPSSTMRSKTLSEKLKERERHTECLQDGNIKNVNIAKENLFTQSHDMEQKEKLLNLYTCTLTKFMEMICGDKERFPFDKTWTERLMRRTCERGIDFDGSFNHLAVLLNARSRDALLRSTFTSRNTENSDKSNNNNITKSKTDPSSSNVAFQHTSSSHFTQIHSNRNINSNSISDGNKRYYIPTIIIQGTHDKLTPLCNAQHLASVIDGSKLIVINGMGHTLLSVLDRQLANIIAENVIRGSNVNCNNIRQHSMTQTITSHL